MTAPQGLFSGWTDISMRMRDGAPSLKRGAAAPSVLSVVDYLQQSSESRSQASAACSPWADCRAALSARLHFFMARAQYCSSTSSSALACAHGSEEYGRVVRSQRSSSSRSRLPRATQMRCSTLRLSLARRNSSRNSGPRAAASSSARLQEGVRPIVEG